MSFDVHSFKVNKDIPIPLYYQIKQFIYMNIMDGNIVVGECLPTELKLMEAFSVSRATIRQALDDLVNSGYLVRYKGKGTFVTKPAEEKKTFNQMNQFYREVLSEDQVQSTTVLDMKVVDPIEEINKQLELKADQKLIFLRRLRHTDKEPIVVMESYLPHDKYKDLLSENFEEQSLYHILETKFDCRVARVVRNIESVIVEPDIAALLKTPPNSAIFLIRGIAYSSDNVPIETTIDKYRGDKNKFWVEITKWMNNSETH